MAIQGMEQDIKGIKNDLENYQKQSDTSPNKAGGNSPDKKADAPIEKSLKEEMYEFSKRLDQVEEALIDK